MKTAKKIIVVTPRFPYPEAGADEQDRASGLRQLRRLGFDIRVIAKVFPWQQLDQIRSVWAAQGIPVTLIPYQKHKWPSFTLDGAAAEYRDPAIQRALRSAIQTDKPDMVWFEYTYLWPLYAIAKKQGIPIAVRSINNEARHFLEEDGRSLFNQLKSVPKYLSEETSCRSADVLFSITPYEQNMYENMNATHVVNLPLRALPSIPASHTPRNTEQLHVFFSGSTYTVSHNRKALDVIVKDIAPTMAQTYPNTFVFHITGAKFPDDLLGAIGSNVVVEGFVEDQETFLQGMDIALSPSFFGGGMQQKVFEPLRRGFPTITHNRAIAGYPFVPGVDFIPAETTSDFCQALVALLHEETRIQLSEHAKQKSEQLFSIDTMDGIVRTELDRLIHL